MINGPKNQPLSCQSIATHLTPLALFISNLKSLEQQYKREPLSIAGRKISQYANLPANKHPKMHKLFSAAHSQRYLYTHIKPGEVVAIPCNMLKDQTVQLLITMNAQHEYQLIIKNVLSQLTTYFQIDTQTIKPWHPWDAFEIRCRRQIQAWQQSQPNEIQAIDATLDKPINIISAMEDAITQNKAHAKNISIKNDLIYHSFRFSKTLDDEYRLFYLRDEKNSLYTRLDIDDTINKNVDYIEHDNILLPEKAVDFLMRVQNAYEKLKSKGKSKLTLPRKLEKLITIDQLKKIYLYILHNDNILLYLAKQQPFRMNKVQTGLARTCHVLLTPEGHYRLILDTKSKLASGKKQNAIVGKGAYGNVKAAWRIDGSPQEWVNKSALGLDTLNSVFEATVTSNFKSNQSLVHKTLLSAPFLKPHKTNSNKPNLQFRIGEYSPKAMGDLEKISNQKTIRFSKDEKNQLVLQLLQAIKICHDDDVIHQDIKPRNILLYKSQNKYHIKLTDFGQAYCANRPQAIAIASGLFESPEIWQAYAAPKSEYHNYFYKDHFHELKKKSIGYKEAQKDQYGRILYTPAYQFSHKANDIWAAGMTTFFIFYGRYPNPQSPIDGVLIKDTPLLRGLLHPNRQNRFTIEQALNEHTQTIKPQPQPKPKNPPITIQYTTTKKKQLVPYKKGTPIRNNQLPIKKRALVKNKS